MNLKGKIALVTGSGLDEKLGPGIGFGCALALANQGARIVVNDIDPSRVATAVGELERLGHKCVGLSADMFTSSGAEDIVKLACYKFGRVDILVTGPAAEEKCKSIDLDFDSLMAVMAKTFGSHIRMAQLCARDMIARKSGGKIIFLTSVYGTLNRKNFMSYDCSKAALNHATKILARELVEFDISVSGVAPGFTLTPGERRLADDKKLKEIGDGLPLGRGATPHEVGRLVAYLAAEQYDLGTIHTIDGGMSLVDYSYDKKERR